MKRKIFMKRAQSRGDSGFARVLTMVALMLTFAVTGAWAQTTEWSTTSSLPTSAGDYKLTTDVSISSTWAAPSGETTIDLNGHGITMTSDSYGAYKECSVIKVASGCTLTIKDTNTSSTEGSRPTGIAGGYITGGHGTSYSSWALVCGGGVFVKGGNFVLDGGTICGNSLKFDYGSDGGGVCIIEDGKFTMNGGYIKDNIGSGGGVCIGTNCPNETTGNGNPGTFIMNGGVISDNNDQSGKITSEVKDIRLVLGKVELRGGKIIGNFCCDDKDANTIEIYSGFTSTSTDRCNFYIPKNESSPRVLTIKESLGSNVYGVRPFYYENDIMYTYQQVFTSGLSGNGGVSNFESIDNDYGVGLNASNEAMLKNTAEVTITVSEVTGGTISAKKGSEDITTAQMGDEITLTATPADGYELEAFSVKDADGNAVTVTDGKFTMPAGTVTISATFKKTMNNKDITEVAIDPVTFTGDPLTPKPVIKDGDKTLIEGTDYTVSYSSNTDAGTATITITGIGNYSGTVEFTFTIEKADATMTAPTAKTGLVTNNKPQVLINAGSAEGGEMQYSLDGTNYSTELPTGTEAKEYTVYYKVVGDKNHNDVAAKSIKVVISKITNTGLAFVEGDAVGIIGEPVDLPKLSNPFNLPVEWISSNEEVATVDQNGVVTLLGPGETEIWVVFKGNGVYEPVSTRFKLTVVQKPAKKSGTGLAFYFGDLKVNKASAKIGEPLELPRLSNPYSLEVEWLSLNEEVATVDKHGMVTLVGPGVTEIWIVFKGNDQFDSVAAMYRLTVEGEPVKPDTSVPTITTQPESVTYVVGDTEYPQLSIEATTTVGDLTYEWFLKNDEGTYQSVGITTSEYSLQAFIGNVIELFRDEAIGDYTFMCKVSNVNGTVESDPATLTIAAGDPSAVKTIKTDVQVDGIRKYVKNGKIVIETPRGLYSISGAQIK